MAYFNPAYIEFFRQLETFNHKDWFDEYRQAYHKAVKEPFENFVADTLTEIQQRDPEFPQLDLKNPIFRINRDVRFAKDKTPYKTHMAANFSRGGRKSELAGFYLQFGAHEIWLGGGCYEVSAKALKQIREKISQDPARFTSLLEAPDFKDRYGEIKGERHKVIPKVFKELRETLPLIANKQFYYMRTLPAETILEEDLMDVVMAHYEAGRAVNDYLNDAILPA